MAENFDNCTRYQAKELSPCLLFFTIIIFKIFPDEKIPLKTFYDILRNEYNLTLHFICSFLLREAAKKVIYLVAQPLKGVGGLRP